MQAAGRKAMVPGTAAQSVSILLVDDEADILTSFKEFLEANIANLTVRTAESGAQGLQELGRGRVNLIISDYKMPGMDGIQFLKRAEQISPNTPKILLTAFPKLDLAIEAINEVSVDKFLTKPIPPDKMLGVVRSLLRIPEPKPAAKPGGFRA